LISIMFPSWALAHDPGKHIISLANSDNSERSPANYAQAGNIHWTWEEHMKGFIAGLAIGMGLGIVFAPEPGKSTRSKLKRKVDDVAQDISSEQPNVSANPNEQDAEQGAPAQFTEHETLGETSERAGSSSDEVAEVLNMASKDELMSVDGIGKATAKRIIKNRPYESADDAVENEVLPEKTLENLKQRLAANEDAA